MRVGLAENDADAWSVYGGTDLSGPALRLGDGVPVDLDWVAGAGIGVGGSGVIITVPVGLTVGRGFVYQDNRFTPYLIPRVSLDILIGDDDDIAPLDDDVRLDVAVGIGVVFLR